MLANAVVSARTEPVAAPNVVERLKQQARYAWELGFKVRFELLDGREASWCEIGGNKLIFVDFAITASEQLEQIQNAIQDYELSQRRYTSPPQRRAA